jgi:flavin reductase (DIM6/NTAB) family NADH-FMN oxidoreductase RutF
MSSRAGIDAGHFRRVLGHHPTGVSVVTALDADDGPVGMTVGSFTSVSLDPPLVAFYPMRGSSTFDSIAKSGTFCVNILASDQEELCRRFASQRADKFRDVGWRASSLGSPILDDVIAWVDCRLTVVQEAGDHLFVLDEVDSLSVGKTAAPLMFFQGGYGRFSAMSLIADAEDDLGEQLRLAELARPHLEELSHALDGEAHASALVADRVIQLAWVGAKGANIGAGQVGLRLPFVPPIGLLFVAWQTDEILSRWLSRSSELSEQARAAYLAEVARARTQGWIATPDNQTLRAAEDTVARIAADGPTAATERELRNQLTAFSEQYAAAVTAGEQQHLIRGLSAPVFDRTGRVSLVIGVRGISPSPAFDLDQGRTLLLRAAAQLTTGT